MPGLTSSEVRHAAIHVALATLLLLLVPLLAMRFTDAVRWTVPDFAVAGVLLFGTGFAFALVLRTTARVTLRLAFGIALAAGLMLVWTDLAVGMLGAPGNPANLMHAGVLAIGVLGAWHARLKPRGMAWAMASMAGAMGLAGLAGLVFRSGTSADPAGVIVAGHGLFAALFLASAALFRRAGADTRPSPG